MNGATWLAAGLVLVVAILNALVLTSSNLIVDDAFIFFRYVENAVQGHGLIWNPGQEAVEGYSSFLYVLVLIPLRWLGFNLVVASQVLNLGLFLVVVFLPLRMMVRANGGPSAALLIGPALLASSDQLGVYARSGMEPMLLATVTLVALDFFTSGRTGPRHRLISGLIFGLLILTRPEAVLLYGVCLLFAAYDDLHAGGGPPSRNEAFRALGIVVVVVPHLAWRYAVYGDLLPNTYYAKIGYVWPQMYRGISGLVAFLGTHRGAVAALALLAWALAPRTRLGNLLAACLVAWMGYVTLFLRLPDWSAHYTMLVDLFAALTLGWSTSRAALNAAERSGGLRVGAAVSAGLVLLMLGGAAEGISRNQQLQKGLRPTLIDTPDMRFMVNQFIAIGLRLRTIAEPNDTIALGAAGAIAYYSGLTTYDALGLNDRHIARQYVAYDPLKPFGHEKGDGAYLLSKRPTFLVPLPWTTPRPNRGKVPYSKSFEEIFAHPDFKRDYRFQSVVVATGHHFNYYERRSRE